MRRYEQLIKEQETIRDLLEFIDSDGNKVAAFGVARSSEGLRGLFWTWEVPEMPEKDVLNYYNWLTRMLVMEDTLPHPDDQQNRGL